MATAQNSGSGQPRRWLIIALVCAPIFIGALDLTIVSAFLPELIVDLELPPQTGLDDAAWIVSAYLLAYTVGLTFTGRLSDLLGRRSVYVVCLLIFMVGSVLVAIAHQQPADLLNMLYRRLGQRPDPAHIELQAIIFGRIVQALGAGAMVPVSMALVGDLFPPEKRARPLGVLGAVDTLGWVLGHLYGGVLVNFFYRHEQAFINLFADLGLNWGAPDWRTLFWINVPVSLLALALTLWALRDVPVRRVKGRFDYPGTFFIIATLVALNIGLGANIEVSATTASFEDLSQFPPYALPLVSLALLCFLAFILVESRVRDPLFNLAMFRRRNLSAGLVTNLFIGYCLFIGLVVVPILVNVRLDDASQLRDAALQVGLLLSTLTVPMALAAVPGGWLSERYGYSRVIISGLGVAILGFLIIWLTWSVEIDTAVIAFEMAIVGIGLGLTFSPVSAAVINAAADEERGVASALVIIVRLIGMTISVSSLTTIALNRVNALAAAELSQGAFDADIYAATYTRITVEVLAELGLLGAALCAAAIIPALMLRQDVSGRPPAGRPPAGRPPAGQPDP